MPPYYKETSSYGMTSQCGNGTNHSPLSMTSSRESQALRDLSDPPTTFRPRRPKENSKTQALRYQVQMLQQSQAMTHSLLQQLLAGSHNGKLDGGGSTIPATTPTTAPAAKAMSPTNGPGGNAAPEHPPIKVETHMKIKNEERRAKAQ